MVDIDGVSSRFMWVLLGIGIHEMGMNMALQVLTLTQGEGLQDSRRVSSVYKYVIGNNGDSRHKGIKFFVTYY